MDLQRLYALPVTLTGGRREAMMHRSDWRRGPGHRLARPGRAGPSRGAVSRAGVSTTEGEDNEPSR